MNCPRLAAALAICAGVVLASPAGAVLVIEEFDNADYEPTWRPKFFTGTSPWQGDGDSLFVNGGSGWAGPWVLDTNKKGKLGDEPAYYHSWNLEYTDATGYVNGNTAGGHLAGPTRLARDFATPFGAGSTVWGSIVMQPTLRHHDNNWNRVEINNDRDDRFGLEDAWGNPPAHGDDVGNDFVQIVANGSGTGSTGAFGSAIPQGPNLLITKLETNYSGDFDRLTLWANPVGSVSDESSLDANASVKLVADGEDIWGDAFSSIGLDIRRSRGNVPRYDAIRFSDVALSEVLTGEPVPADDPQVAIPEPAGLVLAGLAGLALISRRR